MHALHWQKVGNVQKISFLQVLNSTQLNSSLLTKGSVSALHDQLASINRGVVSLQ